MASPGLLFLLLISSSLLISTMSVSRSPSPSQEVEVTPEKLNKWKEGAKATGKFIIDNADQIRNAITPFLAFIPVCGSLISAIAGIALIATGIAGKENKVLDALKEEFQILNSKIDKYHVEQKWDTWASGAYHKPELKINVAWTTYETLVPSLLRATDNKVKENFRKEIIKICEKSESATKTLHEYLKAEPPTFMSNLGKTLAETVKCHEKDMKEYTLFISKLMYKGNTMNQLCYELKQIKTQDILDKEDQIAYDSASAMFHAHMNCILNSLKYIKTEVEELIDKDAKRGELAKTIRSFLDQTYDRYEWMVVAFLTKRSEHKIIETLNKHVLSGFTPVSKGKVTVAISRQAKGSHTMVAQVKTAIKRCITDKVLCYKVAKVLSECKESVGTYPVTQTYTAVHAFTRKAHDSSTKDDDPDTVYAEPAGASASYIYEGKCEESPGVKRGKFVVMIKSDEEIKGKDPCLQLKCNNGGKCVRVADSFVAMCDCKSPYFGKNCENDLKNYKKNLQNKISQPFQPVVKDSRRPRPRF